MHWTVPELKNDGYVIRWLPPLDFSPMLTRCSFRLYLFWISAVQIDEQGSILRNETAYASSEDFSIVGGPKLYPKEIASIVIGSIAGLALLIVAVVFGARYLRKRRSVAIDLGPGGGEVQR